MRHVSTPTKTPIFYLPAMPPPPPLTTSGLVYHKVGDPDLPRGTQSATVHNVADEVVQKGLNSLYHWVEAPTPLATQGRGKWYTHKKVVCPRPPMPQQLCDIRPWDVEFGDHNVPQYSHPHHVPAFPCSKEETNSCVETRPPPPPPRAVEVGGRPLERGET